MIHHLEYTKSPEKAIVSHFHDFNLVHSAAFKDNFNKYEINHWHFVR